MRKRKREEEDEEKERERMMEEGVRMMEEDEAGRQWMREVEERVKEVRTEILWYGRVGGRQERREVEERIRERIREVELAKMGAAVLREMEEVWRQMEAEWEAGVGGRRTETSLQAEERRRQYGGEGQEEQIELAVVKLNEDMERKRKEVEGWVEARRKRKAEEARNADEAGRAEEARREEEAGRARRKRWKAGAIQVWKTG